ncbi:MAG: hypothetical protein AB7V07_02645 [Candidatus Delongbacteria bacterium]
MTIEIVKEKYFEILKDIVSIPSPSSDEAKLAKHLIDKYEGSDWIGDKDEIHNLYFHRKDDKETETLPLLLAHLDTHLNGKSTENNRKLREKDFLSFTNGKVRKKYNIQAGFDDKAGVAAILYLMQNTDLKFRAIFVTQEEETKNPSYERLGGGGIDQALKKYSDVFDKSSYVISLDRENHNDIIIEYGIKDHPKKYRIPLCDEEFTKLIIKCSKDAGYLMEVSDKGRMADVYNIRRQYFNLNCVNLSCGIYNEHNPCESLEIDETINVMKVVKKCLGSRLS